MNANFGVRSDDNNSTTALASGATFTGTPEFNMFNDVMVSCTADNTGTLFFDFSTDGTNWSSFPPSGFEIASGIHEFHTAVKGPRWFRVRLINDSGAQSYLRLQTYYGSFRQGNLPVNANVGDDADAIVVRSVNSEIDLAIGRFLGFETGTKFGRNSDIDTAAAEDVWEGGGTYTGHPEAFTPETVDVVSSSAADTSAGTGARTIRIAGLKASTSTSYETEDITLNGTSAVTSSSTWWRINRAYVLTAGSGGANAGAISIASTTTTANVFASLPIGFNQTQIGAYTVPASQSFILKRLRVAITRSTGAAGSATVTVRARNPGGVYRAVRVFELQTGGGVDSTAFGGEMISAGTDIKFRVENVSDNNTIADAEMEYILVAD